MSIVVFKEQTFGFIFLYIFFFLFISFGLLFISFLFLSLGLYYWYFSYMSYMFSSLISIILNFVINILGCILSPKNCFRCITKSLVYCIFMIVWSKYFIIDFIIFPLFLRCFLFSKNVYFQIFQYSAWQYIFSFVNK